MNTRRIESIKEIRLDEVALSDMRWQYGTGVAVLVSGSGRDKKYRYRNGVATALGDFEESVWYQVIEHIMRRDGETELVEMLTVWESEHNYTNARPPELRKQALQAYASRLFDRPEWVDFIPFNRRFRPYALIGARLVKIIKDCCGDTAEATQEQADRAWNHTVYCHHCGDWTTFSTVPLEEVDPPWQMFM